MQVEVSLLLTILGSAGSTALTLWAHGREFKKEKKATLDAYASSQIKAEGYRRDLQHLKHDYAQLSANVATLDDGNEERFREIEKQLGRLAGAMEILTKTVRRAGD